MDKLWSKFLTMLSRFRSRWSDLSFKDKVLVWSGIFTIGFCGVYVLVNLGIITSGKEAPPDCDLDARHLIHGQQVTCTGKRLDKVAEFRFVRGSNSWVVPSTFHNESRAVLIVTSATPPGEYHLEIIPNGGEPITKSEKIKVISQLILPPA